MTIISISTGDIIINKSLSIFESEISLMAIRSQGAGGQNVNKVASAIHLRFNIHKSSLPSSLKERLLTSNDKRINKEGIIVIKAQQFRTQEKNKQAAIERLKEMIIKMNQPIKPRKETKPTLASKTKRIDKKTMRGKVKSLRKKLH